MYVVMNRIDVEPGKEAGFEASFGGSMNTTLAGVPGLLRSTLLKPARDGLPYVSTMEFTDKDAFMAWMRSDSFKASHSGPAEEQPAGNAVELYESLIDLAPNG